MKHDDILTSFGASRGADSIKFLIWLTITMLVMILSVFGALFLSSYVETPFWLAIPLVVFLIAHGIGRRLKLVISLKEWFAPKRFMKYFVEMDLLFVKRDQPAMKFALWRAVGFLIAIAFTVAFSKLLLEGGDLRWMLAVIPMYILFYLIGRRFGHFR